MFLYQGMSNKTTNQLFMMQSNVKHVLNESDSRALIIKHRDHQNENNASMFCVSWLKCLFKDGAY